MSFVQPAVKVINEYDLVFNASDLHTGVHIYSVCL